MIEFIALPENEEIQEIKMSSFKENIYQGKRFIYEIDNRYYVIGENTFTELTDSAETDILDLLQNAVKKNKEKQIEKYLEKMLRITANYRADSKEHLRTQDKLFAFLDELEENNEEAYEALQNQYMKYVELYQRYHAENTAE